MESKCCVLNSVYSLLSLAQQQTLMTFGAFDGPVAAAHVSVALEAAKLVFWDHFGVSAGNNAEWPRAQAASGTEKGDPPPLLLLIAALNNYKHKRRRHINFNKDYRRQKLMYKKQRKKRAKLKTKFLDRNVCKILKCMYTI